MIAGTKRKQSDDSSDRLYSNKSRSRPSIAEARVDPTYGQRSALPGLDDETTALWDEESLTYDDTSSEALNYLRSVRQEATAIPNLLVAPRDPTDGYNQSYDVDDAGNAGYYEDGAYYISDPLPTASSKDEGDEVAEIEPRLAYFDSILARFETLRGQLQETPPPDAIARLGPKYPIAPPPKARKSHTAAKWWRGQMQSMNPATAQIASMDKSTVLRALGSLTGGKLLRSGAEIRPSLSLWIWALLARLPERGELSSEEIGVVRELGKRAVLVGIGLREKNDWQEGMHEVEAELDDDDEEYEETCITNDEEVQPDIDDGLDEDVELGILHTSHASPQIGPQLPKDLGAAHTDGTREERDESISPPSNQGQPIPSTDEEGQLPSNQAQKSSEEALFKAAKTRLLASLKSERVEHGINIEPETEVRQDKAPENQATKANTRATVDMIITVAGEMYGQRDLLEFRPAWDD